MIAGPLGQALRLLFLYAEKEPIKFEGASRYSGLAAVSELRSGSGEAAAKLPTELVQR
jgi:hypothetical protein